MNKREHSSLFQKMGDAINRWAAPDDAESRHDHSHNDHGSAQKTNQPPDEPAFSREYYERVAVDESGNESRYIEEWDNYNEVGYGLENYLDDIDSTGIENTEMGSFGAKDGKNPEDRPHKNDITESDQKDS